MEITPYQKRKYTRKNPVPVIVPYRPFELETSSLSGKFCSGENIVELKPNCLQIFGY
jgi:hypothetical protein